MGTASLLRAFNFTKAIEVDTDAYYRSRIHTFNTGNNPLVVAAQALIALIVRLPDHSAALDYEKFAHDLTHEFKTFSSRCNEAGYSPEIQNMARYIICACFDEIIVQHATPSENSNYPSLLSLFFPEQPLAETLPILLSPLLENPKRHVDCLEFVFITMSLSYGERHQPAEFDLENLLEKVYAQIRQVRSDDSCQFFITPKLAKQEHFKPNKWLKIVTSSLFISLIIVYGAFNYMLAIDTKILSENATIALIEK